MHILVLNSGSSSIKFQLLDMPSGDLIASGLVERLGTNATRVVFKASGVSHEQSCELPSHKEGLGEIAKFLKDPENSILHAGEEIKAVGHRVVHGGRSYSGTVAVSPAVKEKIKELGSLAPLHNPNNLLGIEVAEQLFPEATQVAVFDTAFHQAIPEKAKRYAIPNKLYKEHGIQVYGFHGTSHQYVSQEAEGHLGAPIGKMITIHLGNGCSMTAIKEGQSLDHSLGFGPSNGLIMGTRSGDIDHAMIFYLLKEAGYTPEEVDQMLTKESGLLGLTGYHDLRDILKAAGQGDWDCQLALEMKAYRIRKFIGAYTAAMNGLDVLVFTAGIGENSPQVREMACRDLDILGIQLDPNRNNSRDKGIREIHAPSSRVKILVIPTNEELQIARQTYRLLTGA